MADLTLTSTYRWDVDVSKLQPLSGCLLIEVDDEEMIRIGDTGLVLGFFEDNRNNAHWFGKVISKAHDVPLELGDQVWFSYLSAKGMDRIISFNKMYLFLKFRDVILRKNDEIEMLNGNILSLDLPPKVHPIFGHVEIDTYYTEVRHAPLKSAYQKGDIVHYWLEQVYELEGQRKLLKENYRVLKEENIITILKQEIEQPIEGMVLVELYQENLELASGIKLTAPVRKAKLIKAIVLRSTCSISEGSDIYVRSGRGFKAGDNWLFKEEHVEALC